MGAEIALTIHEIYEVTPEVTGLPSLLPLNRQRIQGRIQESIMGGPGWVRGDHQSGGWPRA